MASTMQSVSSSRMASRSAQRRAAMALPAVQMPSCAVRMPQGQIFGPATVATLSAAPARSPVVTRAAPAAAPASQSASSETKEWYALVANAEFFFNDPQNESVAEQLRERVRFFKEQNRDRDFYIVPEPKWLEARYPTEAKKVGRPCVALVSTDKNWIVFMKLRLDRVMRFDLGAVPDAEVLAVGGTLPEFKGPEKWTAPYPRYSAGWWEVFYPGNK